MKLLAYSRLVTRRTNVRFGIVCLMANLSVTMSTPRAILDYKGSRYLGLGTQAGADNEQSWNTEL